MNLYSALSLKHSDMAHMRSHSITCHPHTNHTCLALYSPAARCQRPLTGTHCAYPRRDGQIELTWVSFTKINVPHHELNLDTVTHPSINRARRRLTLLIETNALLLCQTTSI